MKEKMVNRILENHKLMMELFNCGALSEANEIAIGCRELIFCYNEIFEYPDDLPIRMCNEVFHIANSMKEHLK